MPKPLTREELILRKVSEQHVISKSLTPPSRRLAMGLPLYSCSCGEWDSYDANYNLHLEAAVAEYDHPGDEGSRCRGAAAGEETSRMTWKDNPHNLLLMPGVCLCAECRAYMRDNLRCSTRMGRTQCGDYKGHRGDHTRLIATVFLP